MYNFTSETYKFNPGDRCAQLIVMLHPHAANAKYLDPEVILVDSLDETERGHAGFGSTGKRGVRKSTEWVTSMKQSDDAYDGVVEIPSVGIPAGVDCIMRRVEADGLSGDNSLDCNDDVPLDGLKEVAKQIHSFRKRTVHPWEEPYLKGLLRDTDCVLRQTTFQDGVFVVDKLEKSSANISEDFCGEKMRGAWVLTQIWVSTDERETQRLKDAIITPAAKASYLINILPRVRDPVFLRVYEDPAHATRLRALIDKGRFSFRKIMRSWKAMRPFLENQCSDIDIRSAFETLLHVSDRPSSRGQFSSGPRVSFALRADLRALRARNRTVAVDCCFFHLVHNPACWVCQRLAQVAHVSARGTSSLHRGRLCGMIVIYCDLKQWPTSLRLNRYSFHFAIFTETVWDEKLNQYKSERRVDLSFASTNKTWECFVYALRCCLTEARITRNDWWFLYIDNEAGAVKSTNSLAFITSQGGDVLTSLPNLHLFIAENTVRRQARIIWAICFSSGINLNAHSQ